MKQYSLKAAGQSLATFAVATNAPNNDIPPSDTCLFVWLVAEASRLGNNPFSATLSSLFRGTEDSSPVGLSLNTIKRSLERLEIKGAVTIERNPATRGERLDIRIAW